MKELRLGKRHFLKREGELRMKDTIIKMLDTLTTEEILSIMLEESARLAKYLERKEVEK